jgi:hypothetical protein
MTVPPAAGFFYSGVYCGGSDAGRVFQDFRKSVALAMHAEDVAATLEAADVPLGVRRARISSTRLRVYL